MLKMMGIILIMGGSIAIGMSANGKLRLRIRVLSALINALDMMYSEISCMLTPTQDILEKLMQCNAEPVRSFFKDCRDNMVRRSDMPFSLIWGRAVKEAEYLELKPQEKQALIDIGGVLGRYEAPEQLKVISHARRNLESHLHVAEKDKLRLGKLYGSLSVVCGLAAIIVLF